MDTNTMTTQQMIDEIIDIVNNVKYRYIIEIIYNTVINVTK